MTIIDVIRLWFIVIWGLSIVGFGASILRFFRTHREEVERKIGPLPTPIAFLNLVVLVLVLVRIGEITADASIGWLLLRVLGTCLSLYSLVMLPWAMRALDRYGIPGVALLRDHSLVTSGPYQLVRHPGYSAFIALWLGTALGTLNLLLLALWPLTVLGAFLSSRAEEKLLREEFGTEYEEYAEGKNRFIPGIW